MVLLVPESGAAESLHPKFKLDNAKSARRVANLNWDPDELEEVQRLIEQAGWKDIGAEAEWWGTEAKIATCQTTPQN